MLSVLRAKNFILMGELELELAPGLNVLTGETGAGKSIVVGALGLVLGGRASPDQVRAGADEAEIEALLELGEGARARSEALRRLAEAGILSGDELAVRRVVSSSGRSRAYLNGRLCTAAELAALATDVADVASQHESVALTDPSTHLEHLDRFAELEPARKALAGDVAELEAMMVELKELRALERGRAEREAFLRFQLGAIDDVAPTAGEIESLQNERRKLRHAERLSDVLRRSHERLEAEDGLCDQLGRLAGDLRAAADLDGALAASAAAVEGAFAELREVAGDVARSLESAVSDPRRLSEIEERLYRLEGLMRQHGPTEGALLEARARIAAELAELEGAESRAAERERAIGERLPAVADKALALSRERKRAAERLGSAIGAELAGLGMGSARVLVEVEPLAKRDAEGSLTAHGARLGRSGIDRVEFLIAPNKGIDPKPLRKIASGGELSRALLALKRVLADAAPARLYVFDEVDTGVGGAVAERIGAAIADVARHHQVLCITHLAPIAAFADAHFVVEKSDGRDVTESRLRRVEGEERVREVARMLAGAKVTPAAIAAAEELLASVRPPKAATKPRPPKERGASHPPRTGKPRYS